MGDIVFIEKNEVVPTDIVILSFTSDKHDYCYIETSNLDGEKTLKPKSSIF